MMLDRCPDCGASVAFHRMYMGHGNGVVTDSMAGCHQCGFELGHADEGPLISYDVQATDWHAGLCGQLTRSDSTRPAIELDSFDVMRQLAMLLTSRYPTVKLHAHLCDRLGVPEMQLTMGRVATETQPLLERHHLIQLIAWLMVDLEPRLRMAWRVKAVRYNHLTKDFGDAPVWYKKTVEGFTN